MFIRRASIDDTALVSDILQTVADWLESRGFQQWGKIDPNGVRKAISEHECFLVYFEDIAPPIATFRIQWHDKLFWGDDSELVDAGYIHRFAIRPEHIGKGLGREILAWAEEYMRERGKLISRLDCAAGNSRLRRFYEEAGYTFIDEIDVGPYRSARFVKEL